MTRLVLETKNITLSAEPSFFILLYFLCKNLLFLCAEHHYPKNMCDRHRPQKRCRLANLGLVEDGSEARVELLGLADGVAHAELGEEVEPALEEVVDLLGQDLGAAEVALGDAGEVEVGDEVEGEELELARVPAQAHRRQDVDGAVVGREAARREPGGGVRAQALVVAVQRVVVD